MYAKAIIFALLSLSLSASAVPAKNKSNKAASSVAASADTCAATAKTVTVTQTVAAAASTGVLAANPGAKGTGKTGTGKTGTGANANKGGNNAGTGNAAAATTTSAAAAATTTAAATTGKTTGKGGNTGNNAASGASANAQTSLTLDPSNVFTAFASDGNANATAGQEPSITSTNNFINFCLEFPGAQKTNGQQVLAGSCNQTPMGLIAAQAKMPSSKFVFPANGGSITANTDFTIQMAINNLETGHFTNPTTTFHMAPQVVNDAGLIKGHSHVVIEQLSSLTQTTVTDPTKFAFFKGLNSVAANGILTADVTGGLPAGFYRLASINSAANHQPALVAVAQRGALDDMVYFTVSAGGATTGKGGNNAAAGTAATSSVAATSSAAAAATSAATTKTGTGRGKGAGRAAGKNRAAF
ncbi:hypothetical protein GSI_11814 [Ganoderma sinense ZZ0214-1]|uniref:CHRD domain-containing protein n=1 Tax=Ganoderma sinense ZZ0214-1 TaxID=1077348 RepID=A0A2G8RX25_9APHY|nr:hypothetical protein GSI_11814 [Ganoderma sinense ZZ0214-1]